MAFEFELSENVLKFETLVWSCCGSKKIFYLKKEKKKNYAVAGDRTRVTRVTGGNTYHYTTTTC